MSTLERLRIETAEIGTLFLVMNGGMLAASLVLGLVTDRFEMKLPLAVGSTAGGLHAAHDRRRDFLRISAARTGVAGNRRSRAKRRDHTLVADLHGDARQKSAALNRLGVFFGFGALFLPLVMGALLAWSSVETILDATTALCGAAGIFTVMLRFPAPKQRYALPVAEIPRFLRSPLVLAFALLLFLESGAEFTLGGFISMYLTRDMAIASVSSVSWILAGYWASIMISRLVLSRVSLGVDPYRTMVLCACGAAARGRPGTLEARWDYAGFSA